MTPYRTLDDLRREAELGKREDFEQFLKLVPDVPQLAGDDLSGLAMRGRFRNGVCMTTAAPSLF